MKIKVTLSGTTLKLMGWENCPKSSEVKNEASPLLWAWTQWATEKRRGRGYFREIEMARDGVENTMDAVEERLWSESLPIMQYNAMLKDAEKLRAALAEFHEEQ